MPRGAVSERLKIRQAETFPQRKDIETRAPGEVFFHIRDRAAVRREEDVPEHAGVHFMDFAQDARIACVDVIEHRQFGIGQGGRQIAATATVVDAEND